MTFRRTWEGFFIVDSLLWVLVVFNGFVEVAHVEDVVVDTAAAAVRVDRTFRWVLVEVISSCGCVYASMLLLVE